ncbi:MAG: ankyrin repeat domain-containing protein [Desulfobacterales bacterium]|nr:MAG: ankyrin repeat domain-containing protein [Desulfobacterales bacterium]
MKIAARIMISFGIILVVMSPFVSADNQNMELLQAVERGDTDRVKALLGEGADANAKDTLGNPALLGAACAGHTEMVKALLAAGADVNAKGALADSTALICAASHGHTESVKALLAASADVNAKNKYAQTALYLGVKGCHTESLKALLEASMDVNVETINVIIALRVAGLVGCTKAADLLKKAAATGSMVQKAKLEIVPSAGGEVPSAQQIPPRGTFAINLASFKQKQSADRYVEELKKLRIESVTWEANLPNKGKRYRVCVGGFPSLKEAKNYTKELRRKGISDTFITKIPEPW